MKIYKFNKKTLKYEKLPIKLYFKGFIMLFTLSFLIGVLTGAKLFYDESVEQIEYGYYQKNEYKGDVYLDTLEQWKDSVFTDYAKRAQIYLDRPDNEGTPLTGEMMALAARNAFDSTGNFLPVELALAQCQWESHMGRRGRSPKNNPWNVGEFDSGTVLWYKNTFEGTQAYYYWVCRTYLSCRTVEQLLVNYVNCNGLRYAKIGYEQHIHNTYINIKRWIDNNIRHQIHS